MSSKSLAQLLNEIDREEQEDPQLRRLRQAVKDAQQRLEDARAPYQQKRAEARLRAEDAYRTRSARLALPDWAKKLPRLAHFGDGWGGGGVECVAAASEPGLIWLRKKSCMVWAGMGRTQLRPTINALVDARLLDKHEVRACMECHQLYVLEWVSGRMETDRIARWKAAIAANQSDYPRHHGVIDRYVGRMD